MSLEFLLCLSHMPDKIETYGVCGRQREETFSHWRKGSGCRRDEGKREEERNHFWAFYANKVHSTGEQ